MEEGHQSWWVAHTRARCEKKVAGWCEREGWNHELPLLRSRKRYRGKQVEFLKPLFPGYVFVRIGPQAANRLRSQDAVANLLAPPDQVEFEIQLSEICRATDGGLAIRAVPEVLAGRRVRIRTGPLEGLEGLVIESGGSSEVILRLDFIGQAAAIHVAFEDLEAV